MSFGCVALFIVPFPIELVEVSHLLATQRRRHCETANSFANVNEYCGGRSNLMQGLRLRLLRPATFCPDK